MEGERLIQMANQIGDFFSAEPDRPAGMEGIANHLRRFWDPRMRRQIIDLLDASHTGFSPLVAEAIRINRDRLLGAAVTPTN
jgi:formate dehydrogenase subunit delta